MSFRSIGIDLGITSLHKAFVTNSEGRQIGKLISFDPSLQGYDKLLEISLQGKDDQEKAKFIMEPTSTSWIALSAYLINQGHEVYLIKPQKSADLRKFYNKHSKSDRIDAKTIAKLPIVDPEGLNQLQMSSPDIYSLYRLSLEREQLVREIEGDKKRIKSIFNMAVPKLFQYMGEWQFSLGATALLKEYANPFKVVELGVDRLREFLEKHTRGPLDPDLPTKIFEACKSACQLYSQIQASGQMPFDYEQIHQEVHRKVDMIQYRQEQIKQIEKQMSDYYIKVDPQKALQSVKGFGPVIACALIGALGNVWRFRNAKTIVSYCGFAPRKKQSGQTDREGMPLTKAGKRIIKKYLYLAGETARQWDPQLASVYVRLRKAGKSHTKAMGAISARMATRAYAILKKIYDPQERLCCYRLKDIDGNPVSPQEAKVIIKEKYQLPKKGKQAKLVKDIQHNSEKNIKIFQTNNKKAAKPNIFFITRQSKTPQLGSKSSLQQLTVLENIVKKKNCQGQVKDFLLQNQNVFESTSILLSWLEKGIDEQDLRETILANISLYRRKILINKSALTEQ